MTLDENGKKGGEGEILETIYSDGLYYLAAQRPNVRCSEIVRQTRDEFAGFLALMPKRADLSSYLNIFKKRKVESGISPFDPKKAIRFMDGYITDSNNHDLEFAFSTKTDGSEDIIVFVPMPVMKYEGRHMEWRAYRVPCEEEPLKEMRKKGTSLGAMIVPHLPEEFVDVENGIAMKIPPFDFSGVDITDIESYQLLIEHIILLLETMAERLIRAKILLEGEDLVEVEQFKQAIYEYLQKTSKLLRDNCEDEEPFTKKNYGH